jgi:hypothetical protein
MKYFTEVSSQACFLEKLSCSRARGRARVSARATIFRRVAVNGLVCDSRILHWIDNFEGLNIAFSCDLELFYEFIQKQSGVQFIFVVARFKIVLRAEF